jgi:GR25 family glycosyltransferase involved in LPS biosynthesis
MEKKDLLPYDFNPNIYKNLNSDLSHMNEEELIKHYINYGINEKRIYKYKYNLPIDFNPYIYKNYYNDISNLSDEDLEKHYFLNGFIEQRLYNLPYNFNYNIYKSLNNDLQNLSESELINHYIVHGFKENREYSNNINDNINDKINFIDSIIWINLIKSEDRKNYMNNILNNINIPNIRLNAVNGENLSFYKLINLEYESKELSKYEIACTLSHIKAIYKLKNIEGTYFMVCEDDISFNNLKYFKKNLKDIILGSPEFDILLLNKICDEEINNIYIRWDKSKKDIYSTASYIISKKCVEKICNFVDYNNMNTFIFHKKINVADIFIYKYVNTYVYKYNFIDIHMYDSTINNSSEKKKLLINNSIKELNLIKKNKDLI